MKDSTFFSLENSVLHCVFSSHGAEIRSVVDRVSGREYIWQAGMEWKRHAPVLFPVIGKEVTEDLTIAGKTYPMSQHGFARDLPFELVLHTDTAIEFELRDSQVTKKMYPFDFRFIVRYELKENTLHQSFRVTNIGSEPLYFSLGGHPAFSIPTESFESFSLRFGQKEELHCLGMRDNLRTGEEFVLAYNGVLPLKSSLFNSGVLVFHNLKSETVYLADESGDFSVELNFTGFPYLGIWAPVSCEKFLCLEPWQGVSGHAQEPKSLEEKDGVLSLAAGSIGEYSFSMRFGA